MSRKDYELLVGVLAQAHMGCVSHSHRLGVERTRELLMRALAGENPRFDADRFEDAFWAKVGALESHHVGDAIRKVLGEVGA